MGEKEAAFPSPPSFETKPAPKIPRPRIFTAIDYIVSLTYPISRLRSATRAIDQNRPSTFFPPEIPLSKRYEDRGDVWPDDPR